MNRNVRLCLIGQLVDSGAEHLPPRLQRFDEQRYHRELGLDVGEPGFGNLSSKRS
jgi:hypothetical protein